MIMWPEEYLKLYKPNEFVTEDDLGLIEYLLQDDVMLMGLVGSRPFSVLVGLDFPTVADPAVALELIVGVLGDNEIGKYTMKFDDLPSIQVNARSRKHLTTKRCNSRRIKRVYG